MVVHSDLFRDILFKVRVVNFTDKSLFRVTVGFNENIIILGYAKTIDKALSKINRKKTVFEYMQLKIILSM